MNNKRILEVFNLLVITNKKTNYLPISIFSKIPTIDYTERPIRNLIIDNNI